MQREQTLEGAREKNQCRCGGTEATDSLWMVLGMLEGEEDCQEEAKEVREKVVASLEEQWQAEKLEEQLLPGETTLQGYI